MLHPRFRFCHDFGSFQIDILTLWKLEVMENGGFKEENEKDKCRSKGVYAKVFNMLVHKRIFFKD